ncbi:MAG TPA: flagellar basal body rod protein FlgB [Nocardioidaceae bacterium]|nr:flagellar basal body rod protein FlgB [Nocardioidaceae bacterium]
MVVSSPATPPISAPDPVAAALRTALDGLVTTQRVTADNIANIDTPGFIASKVDFEGSLSSALADGTLTSQGAAPVVERSTAPVGANGNNVDLATEQMTAMQATFRYQLLARAVGDRYARITAAIGGM